MGGASPHVKPPGRVSPRSRERRLPTGGRALPRRSRGNGADSKLSRLHRSCHKASGARCATVSVEGERGSLLRNRRQGLPGERGQDSALRTEGENQRIA